jgi:hypothetical protein
MTDDESKDGIDMLVYGLWVVVLLAFVVVVLI